MYYITVSNGLLTPEHKKNMGSAVWEFMWCLDKITKIDDSGDGWVLGGKPIKLSEIGMGHDNTTSRNLIKLEKSGYIHLIHAPYGLSIRVHKAKKRFTKNSEPLIKRNTISGEPPTNNGEPPTNNGEPNIRHNRDNTDDTTVSDVPPRTKESKFSQQGAEVIKALETIDAKNKTYYNNKTQRSCADFLVVQYGLETVLKVIKILPQSNLTDYCPIITSPYDLKEKWHKLATSLQRIKNNQPILI